MDAPPLADWARAFALTVAIELPLAVAILRRPARPVPRALVVLLAQLLTHPALWYLAPRFAPYWLWLVVCESGVLLLEALVYARAERWPRAALAALVANLASTLVGLGLHALGWL